MSGSDDQSGAERLPADWWQRIARWRDANGGQWGGGGGTTAPPAPPAPEVPPPPEFQYGGLLPSQYPNVTPEGLLGWNGAIAPIPSWWGVNAAIDGHTRSGTPLIRYFGPQQGFGGLRQLDLDPGKKKKSSRSGSDDDDNDDDGS